MKELLRYFLVLIIASFLIVACKSDDDSSEENTRNLLYLFILDQTSSNCAEISKSSSSGSSYYSVNGSRVPKGGCNAATLDTSYYTTSSSTAETKMKETITKYQAIWGTSSNCSSLSTYYEDNVKANITASGIESSVSSSTNCYSSYGVVYCSSDSDQTSYKALKQYKTVDNVESTMTENYTFSRAYRYDTKSSNGFSDTQIENLKAAGPDRLTILNSDAFTATFYAALFAASFSSYDSAYTSCRDDMYSTNASSKKVMVEWFGESTSYNLTSSDASSADRIFPVGGVVFGSTFYPSASPYLACRYGDDWDETATTNKYTPTDSANPYATSEISVYGTCPSSFTKY